MIIDERERERDSAPRELRNKIKTEISKVASAIGGTPISTVIETISVSDFVWRREQLMPNSIRRYFRLST